MEMPKPIRVGAYMFAFKIAPTEREDELEDALGFFDMDSECIFLDPTLEDHPVRYAEVILHEVSHAVNEVYGAYEDGLTEEEFVKRNSRGWTQVHRDNPDLMEFVKRKLH